MWILFSYWICKSANDSQWDLHKCNSHFESRDWIRIMWFAIANPGTRRIRIYRSNDLHKPKRFAKLVFTCESDCESLDSQNPGKYASLSAASLDILSSRRMRKFQNGTKTWVKKTIELSNWQVHTKKKHTQHIAKALLYYTGSILWLRSC